MLWLDDWLETSMTSIMMELDGLSDNSCSRDDDCFTSSFYNICDISSHALSSNYYNTSTCYGLFIGVIQF